MADDDSTQRFRIEVVRAAAGQVDGIVREALDELQQTHAAYRALGRAELRFVAGVLKAIAEAVLLAIGRDRDLTGRERARVRQFAREMAGWRVPDDAFAAGIEAVTRSEWAYVLEVVRVLAADEVVKREAVGSMSRRMLAAAGVLHASLAGTAETQAEGVAPASPDPRAQFVDRLVDSVAHGALLVADDLSPRSGAALPERVALVIGVARDDRAEDALAQLFAPGRHGPPFVSSVAPVPRPHRVALVDASEPSAWRGAVDRTASLATELGLRVVVDEPTPDVQATARRYAAARRNLEYAFAWPRAVVAVRELKFLRVIDGGDASDRVDFYREVFGALLELPASRSGPLFDTVDGYFTTGLSLERLAGAAGVSDRSVRHRVKRIADLTGLDLLERGQREQLFVAWCLRRVAALLPVDYDAATWGPAPADLDAGAALGAGHGGAADDA